MMYQNKLVVAIKSNGKILRETKDLVHLPFGSEFSVLVKNLNSRRAKFKLNIDGQDVLDGTEIIVDGNKEIELKRFIRNGNMDEGNAFKFIERTQKIEDGPRGIKMDDGVVRVEFWFEQEAPTFTTTYHRDVWWNDYYRPYYYPTIWHTHNGPYYGGIGIAGTSITTTNAKDGDDIKLGSTSKTQFGDVMNSAASSSKTISSNSAVFSASGTVSGTTATYTSSSDPHMGAPCMDSTPTMDSFVNEVGITVPGSKVEQKFTTVYGFNAEAQSHVIVIRIAGKVGAVEVAAPVTVKTNAKCETCGKTNKHYARFCIDCGTSLRIV